MKIAVCIKRTPDSESRFKIAASSTAVDETGLKFDIDDFASYAVEVALQINEKQGRERPWWSLSGLTSCKRRCAKR